jgi:hypothetical protein
MSVYIYVAKRDESPISDDEITAAVAKAPHYTLNDGVVEIPFGGDGPIALEPVEGGTLGYQLPIVEDDQAVRIVDAIRRFAGCIPNAIVDAEGEILEPLPWDSQRPGGAR